MKSLLLVGGLLGWGVGMGVSLTEGNSLPTSLWHGCLAAYVIALLTRWWGRAWRKSLAQSIHEREEAENTVIPAITNPKISRT
jgi:uncharacterized membrane protein YjfL (UPF0719 family)